VALLNDLDAFYLEHRRCGLLDGGLAGDRVWMTCECGAVIFDAREKWTAYAQPE
jgi:hypothetical protein